MSVSYNFAICKWRHSVTRHNILFDFSCLMSILLGCKNSVKTHKFINSCDFTEFLSPVCMCIGCRWARHTPLLQKRWGKCQTTIGTFQPWGSACQIKRVEKRRRDDEFPRVHLLLLLQVNAHIPQCFHFGFQNLVWDAHWLGQTFQISLNFFREF